MDFPQLADLALERSDRAMPELWDNYVKTTQDPSRDGFLSWLLSEGVVSPNTFKKAHADGRLEVLATVPGAEGDDESQELGPAISVLGVVGEGAMGKVYIARDERLRRKVAYKVLKRFDGDADASIRRRFVNEAQITAQLEHPGIVPVHTFENYDERNGEGAQPAFAMKLVYGQTLETFIAQCAASAASPEGLSEEHELQARLDIFLKLCDATAYAHAKGVVHRDLKPENIMLGAFGEVYVMDWGLARALDGDSKDAEVPSVACETPSPIELSNDPTDAAQTQFGQILGTPRYMSPEQAQGLNHLVDERSDQYALGILLHELCGFQPAYPQKRSIDVLMAVTEGRREELRPFPGAGPIPRELHAIIDKATALHAPDRYATVSELANDIRRFVRGDAVHARPDTVVQRISRWARKHRTATASGVAIVLLLLAAVTIWSLVQQAAQVRKSTLRQQKLTQLQQRVFVQAHAVDAALLRHEGQLKRLAAAAVHALTEGALSEEQPWSNEGFEAGVLPPGAGHSSLYGKVVSIDWPVYKLAPGVELAAVRDKLARLMPVRHVYRDMFIRSLFKQAPHTPPTANEEVALLTKTGVPLRWAYIGLAEGLMFSYPGKGGYPPEYDPRKRPWYRLGENAPGIRWGNPYIDLQGQGFILPGVQALYDRDDRFLGVAGIELTFDYLIASLMSPDNAAIQETFLTDAQGRIVVRSGDFGREFAGGTLHEAKKTPLFFVPEVVRSIKANPAGIVEAVHEGRSLVIAHAAISALGWHFVAVTDDSLFKGSSRSAPSK